MSKIISGMMGVVQSRGRNRCDDLKLHLGCFDHGLPGWWNTDITPHLFIARVPGAPFVLFKTGLLSQQRYLQHTQGVFRNVHYLDVTRRFPYPDATVGQVYCAHMLEHLSFEDEAKFCVGEIYRVLKRGGVVRIAVPDLDKIVAEYDPMDPDSFLNSIFEARQRRDKNRHRWHYNTLSLIQLLTDAGFGRVYRCAFRQGSIADVESIDQRPESLFVEGIK